VVRFRNGSFATVTMTTTYHANLPNGRYGGGTLKRAQVHGVDGSATVEQGEVSDWVVPDGEPKLKVPEAPPVNVFQDLAWALADPERPAHTLIADDDALASVYVTTALRHSAATGRYVSIEELRPR
jgi:predicted dehydrogenase